ncbi:uncharacterized protein LOC131952929 [Physella acuta]|uniref:uncharacterized protein LOC131952929 n=1 Tax=Physella acuta TaxID=109671 RepID=UPI0027DAFBB9|nr:uncharacterized protein LOC131952929 [Physella acuta]
MKVKDKENHVATPSCQHISWLQRFTMEFMAVVFQPLDIAVGIYMIFFLIIGLSLLESIVFSLYLPNCEVLMRFEGVFFLVVPTCLVFNMATHVVLFEKFISWILRNLPDIKWEEDTRTIFLEKDMATVDLDAIIYRFAWQKLLSQSPKNLRDYLIMQKNFFSFDVDWKALNFDHKVTKFGPKVKDDTSIKTFMGEKKTGAQWVSLLSCYYDNRADTKQSHTFKGSRDTMSWVNVDLDQYYTVDQTVRVRLSLPETAHFKINNNNILNLFKDRGQIFKKNDTWKTKSQVEVEPSSRAHAQLLVRRECSVVEFEIRTTLSNPKGFVRVDFKFRCYDFSMTIEIENLHEAFQLVEDGGVLTPEEKACVEVVEERWLDKDGVEHVTYHPQIITRGTCVCLSWTDQKVDIKTSPLSMDESTSDVADVVVSHSEENASDKAFVFVDKNCSSQEP